MKQQGKITRLPGFEFKEAAMALFQASPFFGQKETFGECLEDSNNHCNEKKIAA